MGFEADVTFDRKLLYWGVTSCSSLVSGVVVTDVLKKTGFNLTFDVIGVNSLAENPWDVLVCWH